MTGARPDLREELLLSIGTDALAVIEQYCVENDLSLEFYVEANATKPGGIIDRCGLNLEDVTAENIAKTLFMARLMDDRLVDPSEGCMPTFGFQKGSFYG